MERAAFFDPLQQDDTQPLSLGQYRLLEELGRGGMGRVYKALHTIMGRVVAVKVVSPELVSDPVAVEWFRREVRASTQLHHPNIVMAYDANESEGVHFLVMEYVHGMTLDALVRQRGPLPIARACALMRQTALGLQHAHDKSMVHRDIKPSNLLIPQAGENQPSEVLVKILDFGLARLHGQTKGDTIALRGETGVLGTPDYIAPEQSRDIHAADIRSDLYSLGCVFYFTLAGRVPFPGENAMEKLLKHLMEQPEPLEKVRPEIPNELGAIVRRLMAKDPAERYQTPAELVRELEVVSGTFSEVQQQAGSESDGTPVAVPSASPIVTQTEHTRILDSVDVFASSQRKPEVSGPSLLEPVWKNDPDDQFWTDSHDTLALSCPESAPSERTVKPAADGGIGDSPDGVLPPIDADLFHLWCRWLGLLETIVAGRGPSHVNGEVYQDTHTLLLQSCRSAIDSCPFAERRAFYEECLSIAQPWLKLQTFAHTDADMLDSLLQRCRQIEAELNGGKAPWTIRQGLALGMLALSSLGAAVWYFCYGRRWLPALFRAFQDDFSLSSIRWAWGILRAHPTLLVGVAFPLLVVFSILFLSRSQHS